MADEAQRTTEEPQLVATFLLGDAVFGVRADEVQEVVRPGDITTVHHAPDDVVGIRNLRGRIVTVLDLALRLGLPPTRSGPDTRLLIVESEGEPLGLLVNRVGDTVSAVTGEIQPAPSNVDGVQARNLRGVYRAPDRLVAILDLRATLAASA